MIYTNNLACDPMRPRATFFQIFFRRQINIPFCLKSVFSPKVNMLPKIQKNPNIFNSFYTFSTYFSHYGNARRG